MEEQRKEPETFNIRLQYLDMAEGIHGMTTTRESSPGVYNIYLNSQDGPQRNLLSFLHEMTHIFNHDFYRTGETADSIEARTARQLREALDLLQAEQEGQN